MANLQGRALAKHNLRNFSPGAREMIRVRLLGGFSLSVGPRTIEESAWRLRKAAGLVKLLALTPGHRIHRDQMMHLLWPELNTKAAANNLRRTLHVARRTLEPAASATASLYYLRLEGDLLVLCSNGTLWVDVEAFEEAAATARELREPAPYRAALDLYAGDLLPGDLYEEWVQERREQLRRTYLDLARRDGRIARGAQGFQGGYRDVDEGRDRRTYPRR